MRKFGQVLLVLLLIGSMYGVVYCQGIRPVGCELFNCDAFKSLVALVQDISTRVQFIEAQFPVTVEPDPEVLARMTVLENEIAILRTAESSVWVSGQFAVATGATVTVPIWYKGEAMFELTSFGLHALYDTVGLTFVAADPAGLTTGWAGLSGNETAPGDAIVGGFAGAGRPVVGATAGTLFLLRFTGAAAGTYTVTLEQYIDGLANVYPQPLLITIIVQ